MTEGDADTHERFFEVANQFGFTFNWGYANREGIGFFSSGLLPVRAPGLDRRLPTLGTGDYEWQGFLEQDQHPHADTHPNGRLLNWNNQAAPGFMHADNNLYGSVDRVEGFDQWPDEVDLAGTDGEPPSELAGDVVALLDGWIDEDAPLLDGEEDGNYDEAGALIFGELLGPLFEAAVAPVLGDVMDAEVSLRGIGPTSLLDKDLRALLGQPVEGAFRVAYCGAGDLDDCRDALWDAVDEVTAALAAEYGDDPAAWRAEGQRTTFVPNLIPDDFRATNRPTFQQVLEFAPEPS